MAFFYILIEEYDWCRWEFRYRWSLQIYAESAIHWRHLEHHRIHGVDIFVDDLDHRFVRSNLEPACAIHRRTLVRGPTWRKIPGIQAQGSQAHLQNQEGILAS